MPHTLSCKATAGIFHVSHPGSNQKFKAYASPVLINSNLSASDENSNVKTEDVIFHGANFNRLLSECEGNSA